MNDTTRTLFGARAVRAGALGLVGLLACGQAAVAQPAPERVAARQSLTGLFRLQTGTWSGGAHGSYFRMLQPDGKTYLTNTSSKAGNKSYTLLKPGTDRGLRTGAYQTTPKPAFAANGDARAGKVTAPTDFFGVKFATATNKVDPQTKQKTAVPRIYATGTKLSGNLSAFAASWNNQHFNQGSPKPNGKSPGFTRPVSGSYNPKSRAFSITWRSLIVGGPFNKFTGEWHLRGTFVPAKAAASTPAAPAPSSRAAATPAPRPTPRRTVATSRSSARPAVTTPPSKSASAQSRTAKRSTAAAHPKAPTPATSSSVAARSTSGSASPLAARNVADDAGSKVSGTSSGLLIGGGIALVALLGLGIASVVRIRSAR